MIGNMKLGDYFDFRFLPGFSFVNHKISYLSAGTDAVQVRDIESVLVQAPFQIRYKSDPFHDMRVFVLGGIKYTYDVASNARIRAEQANRTVLLSLLYFLARVKIFPGHRKCAHLQQQAGTNECSRESAHKSLYDKSSL
jgi:hypothetical protein